MTGNFVSVTVKNADGPSSLLKVLRRDLIPIATRAAAEYLLGNEGRGLRHLAPYKYVSRLAAYGVSFFSAKQRAFVMAKIRDGSIRPGSNNRTGAIASGWEMSGNGAQIQIFNRVPGVGFVMGDKAQARQPAAVGHLTVSQVTKANRPGMIRAALEAISRLRKNR